MEAAQPPGQQIRHRARHHLSRAAPRLSHPRGAHPLLRAQQSRRQEVDLARRAASHGYTRAAARNLRRRPFRFRARLELPPRATGGPYPPASADGAARTGVEALAASDSVLVQTAVSLVPSPTGTAIDARSTRIAFQAQAATPAFVSRVTPGRWKSGRPMPEMLVGAR